MSDIDVIILNSFIEFINRDENLKKSFDSLIKRITEGIIQYKNELEKDKNDDAKGF